MKTRIGQLDRLLTILRPTQTGTDALGQPITELQPVSTVWAQKRTEGGDEDFSSDQRFARRRVVFRTWHLTDIEETDTLECDGFRYDVKMIEEIGFREGIEITADWQQ